MSKLVLKRVPGDARGSFALFYNGEMLPYQCSTTVESNPHDLTTVTVQFSSAPDFGVIIEGDEPEE